MDSSMKRLRTAAVRTRWVAQAGIGYKDASGNKSEAEYTQQNWSPDRPPAGSKDLPQSNGETEREQPTDKEVSNLHPSAGTQAEITPVVVPRAVTWTGGTLN